MITIEEQERISYFINKQKGRNYPYSNQIVICGFFGTDNAWKSFQKEKEEKKNVLQKSKEELFLSNEEHWIFFPYQKNYLCRGYRFYKIKVDERIDGKMFFENIYPYCTIYCKEIEWL